MKIPNYEAIGELRTDHVRLRKAIRNRLQDFASVPTGEIFYELIYCLLTPQSSAVCADSAVRALRVNGFREKSFDPTAILRRPDAYIRFHNTKAQRLLEVREQFADISAVLRSYGARNGAASVEGEQIRTWLVGHVMGLGMKEASHFLRNIGYRNLAILDRHILRNLRYHGVLRSIPAALTTQRYLRIEDRFRLFSETIGIPLDELDLLFWSKGTGEIRK